MKVMRNPAMPEGFATKHDGVLAEEGVAIEVSKKLGEAMLAHRLRYRDASYHPYVEYEAPAKPPVYAAYGMSDKDDSE
jgi:hypothetical protein